MRIFAKTALSAILFGLVSGLITQASARTAVLENVPSSAQTSVSENEPSSVQPTGLAAVIEKNPSLASTVYQPYSPREGSLTPAPRGFKPFYISHYGRHGSRYYTSDSYFSEGAEALEKLSATGALSAEGEALYAEFRTLEQAHEKMYGELTPRGAREHQGISRRMYERFGRVFRNRKRPEVHVVSSTIPRCIMSMANFTTTLKGQAPKLSFTYVTGQKYFELLAHGFGAPGLFEDAARIEDSLGRATGRYEKLFRRILKDPEQVSTVLADPYRLAHGIYIAGCIDGCMDFLGTHLFAYFEPDELATFVVPLNDRIYGDFDNSLRWGQYVREAAKGLAKDFVEKADAALAADSPVAADLRFGHDSGIMPLLALLEIGGNGAAYPTALAHEHWFAHEQIPMGTNLQLVFYRNSRGEVLVKVLYNEAETTVGTLVPRSGPYYRWEDLRAWILAKAE